MVNVPEVDCAPLHAPEAVHASALVALQVIVEVSPLATVAGAAEMVTTGTALTGSASAALDDDPLLPPLQPVRASVDRVPKTTSNRMMFDLSI